MVGSGRKDSKGRGSITIHGGLSPDPRFELSWLVGLRLRRIRPSARVRALRALAPPNPSLPEAALGGFVEVVRFRDLII